MDYKLGEQYEMRVAGIRVDSAGFNYIALHDHDSNKEYRVYNILKCQYESLPETLYVKVRSIDAFGKIKFIQDEGRLNREHYQSGGLYSFEVKDVREDSNTKAQYYVIEDDFTSHRFYFTGNQKHEIGDDCILEVEGFTDKGFLKLKEMEHHLGDTPVKHAIEPASNDEAALRTDNSESLPIADFGEEGETLEYKTTIVFPPDCYGEANIDKQIRNIIKVLAAFMNTEGGVLYIGIHDKSRKITGIENDFEHLNDSERDIFEYQPNIDGYQLKIRNTIEGICTGVAGSLVHFSFETVSGKTYCKIDVDKAKRPVYIDGKELYVRRGNRNKMLKDEDITMFVYDRMSLSIKEIIDTDDLSINVNPYNDLDQLKALLHEFVNTRNSAMIPVESLPQKKLGEIDWWIVWHNDGTWVKQRNKSDEANVAMQLPVYKELTDGLLAFCYSNGKVNVMKVSTFLKGARANAVQNKRPGWSRTGEKPENVFLMHATDFLVGYSIDSDGVEHVKLHSISDYTVTKSAANEGSAFIPQNDKVLRYAVIGAEHKRKVEHLIVPKGGRSNNAGPALTSATVKDEIAYLKKVLEGA